MVSVSCEDEDGDGATDGVGTTDCAGATEGDGVGLAGGVAGSVAEGCDSGDALGTGVPGWVPEAGVIPMRRLRATNDERAKVADAREAITGEISR